MQSRRAHRSPRQRGFRPQLEAVEERCCPTCSVAVLDGHVLQVRGDAGDDSVRVAEARDGTVSVTCDGDEPHRFTGIDRLLIDTGDGGDHVSVSAEAGRLSQVTVTLGEVGGPSVLSLLTLFPLGALEMAHSVEDDQTGHLKHHATAAVDVLRPTSVSLAIDVPFDAEVSATFRGPAFGTARIEMIDPGNRATAFIRYILAEAFSAGSGAFRNLKAIGDMNERLRTTSATLRAYL